MGKNPSSASDSEVTVFIDTSLGTHLAMTVYHHDTVSELKGKIENEHQLCFTSMEKIKIDALKVKRKGCFYHLSDSMLVKNSFRGVDKNWFLHADATSLVKCGENQHCLHNFNSNNQICFETVSNALVRGVDHPSGVRKRLSSFDDSMPLLLEGNEHAKEKVTIADRNGSVDSARETSKDLEMGVKHSDDDDDDHYKTFQETIKRPEPELQEDCSLCSEGYAFLRTQNCNEDSSRKEISDVKCNVSLEKASPAARKRRCKTKQKIKETVHLRQSDASVHGFDKEQLQLDMTIGNHYTTSSDVLCDMVIGNQNTIEEPCRSSASNMDNRSDSGIHKTNDTYRETEVPGKRIEHSKDTSKHNILVHYNTVTEEASHSQPAAKKKRKFENIAGRQDSLTENNVLVCDSNKATSKPEISSEPSLGDKQKSANAIVDGSIAVSSDLLTNSSSKGKKKKRKISSNPPNEVVDAAPSRRDVMDERPVVAAAVINDKNSSREDGVASSGQGLLGLMPSKVCEISLKENLCAHVQELQEKGEVPSSLDVNNNTDAGNVESESHASEEKLDGHPPLVVKVPSECGTDQDERVGEERDSSQRNDSEAVLSEKRKLSSLDKSDGNNTKVIVTSEMLDGNGTSNLSKKARKTRKTKDSIGETLIKSGAKQAEGSEHGISLAEPHEAVHGEHVSDKAKKEESHLSQKNGTVISKKETGSAHLVRETDNLDGNEVGTLQQIGKPQEDAESMNPNRKKKSKRKQSAVMENLPNLQAEAQTVGEQNPALKTDNRTEMVGNIKRRSALAKTTSIGHSKEKGAESDKDNGVQVDSVPARSNSVSVESTKVPSHGLEHISDGRPLEANLTGNPPKNGCSNEGDNHMKVSCEDNKSNFDKHLVPSQCQHEVVASGEGHAEEVTRTDRADNKPKAKKNRKKLDLHSTGPSSDLQSSLKSNDNQVIGGKSEAGNSSSLQPQSKSDGVMPHSEKKFPMKVSKTGTKTLSSDTSGKINSIPEAAGKNDSVANDSGTITHAKRKKEAFTVSKSNLENSGNKAYQNKMGNKRQPGVNRNRAMGGKAFGEVVNSSENRKRLATSGVIFKDDSSGSSEGEGEDEVDDSDASTRTPSDYSLSSDYSDGESNAHTNLPRNGSYASPRRKAGGRRVIKSCTSGIKDMKFAEILKSSSRYKKAQLSASQSQPDEESEAPEFVPDSQPIS